MDVCIIVHSLIIEEISELSMMKQAENLINRLEENKTIFSSDERNLIVNYAYKMGDMDKTKELAYRLAELEEIARKLESGNLNLDEAIESFEKGIKLSKECTKKLDEAEKKINILVQNENGELVEEKFEEMN